MKRSRIVTAMAGTLAALATTVALAAGPAAAMPARALPLDPPVTLPGAGDTFVGGGDRYATSVEVSKLGWSDGAKVVYIANGETFPDALSAGPAAAVEGAPLLLTRSTQLPAVVAAEIARLKPGKIVVVGGPAAVSDAVYTQLSKLTGSIVRYFGDDRYGTSRAVANHVFAPLHPEVAWVATGVNFPDALAATPVAGRDKQPIILVPGAATSIDARTQGVLQNLGIRLVYIAGGPSAVSTGIETRLGALGIGVNRYSGNDRYQTALAVASGFWPMDMYGEALLFRAPGWNFPDALTGGPLAARWDMPIILQNAACSVDTSAVLNPANAWHFITLGAAPLWSQCR